MARLPLPPAEPMKLVPLAEIAKGGMGSVELARAVGGRFNGTALAIKRLNANVASDPQFVGMFLDEAWMTAALKSPNVVQVAAWGNDEKGMFLAVELVQGVSLSRLIKESRENEEPFAERSAANIGSQICAGMAAAHALRGPDGALLGLVHRDLTPGNILVSFDGLVKIADFGIAKAEERITHTRTGTLKGKPAYMAPEQARGGKVDHRADIFSFGVMMYEMLAGRRPWTAKAAFDVMMEASTTPAPDLASLRKNCNPLLVEIVHRCLEKKPEDRWKSATEIQARLDAWRAQKGFTSDDAASLAHFVRRNSQKQIAWFEQALRGDFVRTDAPTFKELEELIDESREEGSASSRPEPAAGRSELRSLPAKSPKAIVRPAAAPAPAPDPPPDPLEAATIAYDPAPRAKPKLDSAVRSPIQSPLAARASQAAGSGPAPLSSRSPLAGTELMSNAPVRAAMGGLALPPSAALDPRASAVPAARSSSSSLEPMQRPPARASGYAGAEPVVRTAPGLEQTADDVAPTKPVQAVRRPPSLAAINAARPSLPQRSGGRTGAILLLVALPLVGFGVVAAWRYKDRIFPGRGAPPATAAPASPPPAASGEK